MIYLKHFFVPNCCKYAKIIIYLWNFVFNSIGHPLDELQFLKER